MIRNLKLTYFMQHQDLEVEFTDGLQVLRGRNEAGKSTVILGVAYALYGSSVLPTPLSEIVTWGRSEKDLKVELTIEVEGKVFVFVRSKNGAEVVVDGKPFVTGQKDTAQFAAQLLGADAETARVLMFANQNGLRGALDKGPKGASVLIEQLSDLEIFDRLLEAAQEKLSLGAPTIFEERLKGLKAQIEILELPEKPDETEFETLNSGITRTITTLENGLAASKESSLAATTAWKAEYDKRWKRDCLVQDIEKYQAQRAETVTKREAELAQSFPTNLEGLIVDLKSKVEMESNHGERATAFEKFEAYRPPEARIDETIDKVNVRLKDNTTATSTARTHVATLRGDIKALEAQIVSASVCGFCDRDVSQFPEVAAKNERTLAEIDGKRKEIAETEARIEGYKQAREVIDAILDAQQVIDRLARSIGTYIAIDTGVTPNRVTWKGEVPTKVVTNSTPKLREAEAQLKALNARDARVEAYDRVIAEATGKIRTLQQRIADLGLVADEQYEALEQAYLEAAQRVTGLEMEIANLKAEREATAKAFADKGAAWDRAAETETRLRNDIAQVERDIGNLAFNNALVKKLRACRPLIANKLWSLVLTSVSTLFSQMRGEKSVVTKGTNGFMVNGQSIESLSGSTLDLLGLAVRVALTKTFLPGCPMLVLDEPSAACDSSRSEALFGFVAASGFKQVLLITHNEMGDAVADNLILL